MTNGNDSIHNSEEGVQDGLTKREYFAAMALQGLLANLTSDKVKDRRDISRAAVIMADELINELNKNL